MKKNYKYIVILNWTVLTLLVSGCSNDNLNNPNVTLNSDIQVAFNVDGKSVSGLSYDGNFLWVTLDGEPWILKIDPESGEELQRIPFFTKNTGGSAFDGKYLWQIAYLDRTISKINLESGEVLMKIVTPGLGNSMSAGMTFDGQYLWVSNFDDGNIYQIDPEEPTRQNQIIKGGFTTTGLAWDGVSIWNGILVGVTKDHGMVTPKGGYVQKRNMKPNSINSDSFSLSGVGPGTSDWIEGEVVSSKFWWFSGVNNQIMVVKLR